MGYLMFLFLSGIPPSSCSLNSYCSKCASSMQFTSHTSGANALCLSLSLSRHLHTLGFHAAYCSRTTVLHSWGTWVVAHNRPMQVDRVSPLLGCDIHCATCSYGCHVFRGMSHHISYCTQYCQNPQVWPLLPTPPHTERCKVIHTYLYTPVCISVCASCYMQNTTSTCWTR